LVWRFVGEEIPGLEPKIREIFSRRGAYRRWKNFLEGNDLLDKWHTFENEATRRGTPCSTSFDSGWSPRV